MTENFSDLFLDRRSLLFNYSRARPACEEILEISVNRGLYAVCVGISSGIWKLNRF